MQKLFSNYGIFVCPFWNNFYILFSNNILLSFLSEFFKNKTIQLEYFGRWYKKAFWLLYTKWLP